VSVLKTRPPVRSTPWSEREGVLRRLRPDTPLVKTPDTGQSDDAGGRGGPGLDWPTIGRVVEASVDPLAVVAGKGGGGPGPAPRGRKPLPRSGRPSLIGVYRPPSPATDLPQTVQVLSLQAVFRPRNALSTRGSRVRVPDGPPGIPGTYAGSFRHATSCGVSGRPQSDPRSPGPHPSLHPRRG
jgi:hypothetical protein